MKKQPTKLLFLLLAVIMLLGVMPITAMPALAAEGSIYDSQGRIKHVEVPYLEEPVIGAKARSDEYKLKEDIPYRSFNFDVYSYLGAAVKDFQTLFYDTMWIETDEPITDITKYVTEEEYSYVIGGIFVYLPQTRSNSGLSKSLCFNGRFKPNKYYTWVVNIESEEDGAEFAPVGNMTASINGKPANVSVVYDNQWCRKTEKTYNSKNSRVIWKCFGPLKSVDLFPVIDITPPNVGETPNLTSTVPSGKDYEAAGQTLWFETTEKTDNPLELPDNVKLMSPNDKFQPGKYYTVWTYLKPKESATYYKVFSIDCKTNEVHCAKTDASINGDEVATRETPLTQSNGQRMLACARTFGPLVDLNAHWDGMVPTITPIPGGYYKYNFFLRKVGRDRSIISWKSEDNSYGNSVAESIIENGAGDYYFGVSAYINSDVTRLYEYSDILHYRGKLTSISVTTPPTKTAYKQGESFNKAGMSVRATYADGSRKTITNYTVVDGTNLAGGKTSVTVAYTENGITKTAKVTITVKPRLVSIALTRNPNKMTYKPDEPFVATGMVVTATYSDGTTAVIDNNKLWIMNEDRLLAGMSGTVIRYTEDGIQKSCDCPVHIVRMTGISVTTPPTKTVYNEREAFNPAGMVVTAIYSDGTRKPVTGYWIDYNKLLTIDVTSLTIKYYENGITKSTTQAITVNPRKIIDEVSITGVAEPKAGEKITFNYNSSNYLRNWPELPDGNYCYWIESDTPFKYGDSETGLTKIHPGTDATFKSNKYYYFRAGIVLTSDNFKFGESVTATVNRRAADFTQWSATSKDAFVGCNMGKVHTHSYGNWQTVLEATCDNDGLNVAYCSCGKITTAWPPATNNHEYEFFKTITKVDCTTEGIDEYHCKNCTSTSRRYTEATGHDWSVQDEFWAWDFVDENTHNRYCKNCGFVEQKAHVPDREAPTPNTPVQCTGCGYIIADEIFIHDFEIFTEDTYVKGSPTMPYFQTSDEALNLVRVLVDGKELAPANYTQYFDNTKISFMMTREYLDSLAPGVYKVKVESTNGPTVDEFTLTIAPPPTVTKYDITVYGGKSDCETAAENDVVTLTAVTPAGKRLDKWEVLSGDTVIINENSETATFIMPAEDVEIKATYIEGYSEIYYVNLPSDSAEYTAKPENGYTDKVNGGCNYKFTVTIDSLYKKGANFAVKANGVTLSAGGGGVYTIHNITEDQTVTVEGLELNTENRAATPVINPNGGSFKSGQTVTITCKTKGAKIYYSTDGKDPDETNSILYTGPITLTKTTTIKAFAEKSGMFPSGLASATFAEQLSFKLSTTEYVYNGKAKTPSVTVQDSKGKTLKKDTDYTVKYASGRKNVGKYTVTVTLKGKYSGTKKLTFTINPKATSKITVSQTTTSIKATWSKVSDATGYKVYLYKGSKLVSSKTVSSKTTSYNFTKLTAGTAYTVKVKAYQTVSKVNYWSAVKSLATATAPKATSKITATQTTTTLTAKWSKVSGATGYKVYLYKGSKLVKSATTKSTSYKFTKLTAGTKYTVKVKAYQTVSKVNYWSAVKSLATATKTATPSIKSLKAGTKSATVKWSNVAGESGYQVYYATSKTGTYKKGATTKANDIDTTIKNLTKGKTYYFKVRAYTKTTGGTVYSAWSAVKSVKVK